MAAATPLPVACYVALLVSACDGKSESKRASSPKMESSEVAVGWKAAPVERPIYLVRDQDGGAHVFESQLVGQPAA